MNSRALALALLTPPDGLTRENQKATIYTNGSRKLMRPLWMTTAHHRVLCARMEVDPGVNTYNERPPAVAVPIGLNGKASNCAPRLVSMAHDSQLTIHTFEPGIPDQMNDDSAGETPAWTTWAEAHGFIHKQWTAAELFGDPLELENLLRLLPYVCNPAQPVDLLLREKTLLTLRTSRKWTLHQVLRSMPESDPDYVTACIAALVLDRTIRSDIDKSPLSLVTQLSAYEEFSEVRTAPPSSSMSTSVAGSETDDALPAHEDTRFHRHLLAGGIADRASFQASAIGASHRDQYQRHLNALVALEQGACIKKIVSEHKISKSHIYYLKDRWNKIDRDGNPLRYRALGKFVHIGTNCKIDLAKLSGGTPKAWIYQALLRAHPTLDEALENWAIHGLQPGSKKTDRRPTHSKGVEVFEHFCSVDLGIKPGEYPFQSKSNAKETVIKDIRRRRARHKQQALLRAHIAKATNPWFNPMQPPTSCYMRAQTDGWHVDVEWVIEFSSLRGEGKIRTKVTRLWLIPILEVKSTAVLGYSVAFGENYESADVARALRSSQVPWIPRKLSFNRLSYRPGECLPNALIPELAYVLFDELHLDNASSHRSSISMTVAQRILGCTLVFGAPGEPNARPEVELLFDLLAEALFHVIPGTTGSSPLDPRRMRGTKEDPLVIDIDLLLDCIDLLICRYNTGISPGTSDTRLKILEHMARRETTLLRRIPLDRRELALKYDVYELKRIGTDKGKPVVRFENADYEGEGLLTRPDLVGQEVLVACNSLDPRVIEVFLTSDGSSLGLLQIERRWRSTPVSLATRKRSREHSTYDGFSKHAADISLAIGLEMEARYRATGKGGSALGSFAAVRRNATANPDAPTLAHVDPKGAEEPVEAPSRPEPLVPVPPVPLRAKPNLTLVPSDGETLDPSTEALRQAIASLGTTY